MDSLKSDINCTLCFSHVEENNFTPATEFKQLYNNCFTFLLSEIATNHLSNSNQPQKQKTRRIFCKKCLDAALELADLNDQITKGQKQFSDLSVLFNIAILNRRSQNETFIHPGVSSSKFKTTTKSLKSVKQIIKLDVTGLSLQQLNSPSPDVYQNTSQSYDWPSVDKLIFNENLQDAKEIKSENRSASSSQDAQLDFTEDAETTHIFSNLIFEEQYNNIPEFNERPEEIDPLEENVDEYKPFAEETGTTPIEVDVTNSLKIPRIQLERINNIVKRTTSPIKIIQTKISVDSHPHSDRLYTKQVLNTQKNSVPEVSRRKENDRRKFQKNKKTKGKNYKCKYCVKTFTRKDCCTIHERVHTGEKPYVCTICRSAFAQYSTLIGHMRIHTGERPHKCDLCEKAFHRPCQLMHHRISIHS